MTRDAGTFWMMRRLAGAVLCTTRYDEAMLRGAGNTPVVRADVAAELLKAEREFTEGRS